MAIVGTAYIKIQAITTDFKKEADRAYEKFFRMVTTGYAIGPALATAVGGISSMVSGLVALTSQIAAALPALIVLPSVFSAIGQAALTAKLAFSGIGAAMKALTKKGGGGGDNSKRIEQAEKRLAQVLESNREALVRANDRLTEAEERLTKARIDAAESLQQLNFDAEDAAISEKKAAIELEKARETLARVQDLPPNSRARREAELAYQEADLNMRRAKDANSDLAKETEKRNKLGVEGSEEVVDATKAVQEAVDARAKAELEALRALTDAQEALNDAKKGSGGGGADDEALSKLSKEARAFAEYLVSIQPELVKLRHAAGRELFGPMTSALDNIVKKLFPALEPILQKTGAALGKTALDFSNIVTENENLKELAIVADTNSDSIGKLGTIFGNLYDVMLSLLTAADPLVRRFTDWLVTLTTGWKETRELKNQTGELRDMFNQAGDIAAQLGRALGKDGLFGAIMNIGEAAAGPGSGGEMLLDTFEKSMKKFDEFTAKMLGDGSLEKFFLDASDNFSKISTLAVDLIKEILKLGDDAALGESADSLGKLVPILGEIFEILQEAGPYLADFVVKLGEFIRLFTESESIKMFFGTLELALGVLIKIFSNPIIMKITLFTAAVLGVAKAFHLMFKVGKFVFLLLTKYVGFAIKAFKLLKFEMFRVQYYFVTLSTPVLVTIAAIAALVAIFVLAYANSEKLRNALKDLYEKVLAKVVEVFNEVKDALEEVMASMGSTEGAGKTFKNIFKSIGDFIAKYLVPILEKTLMPLIEAVGNAFKAIIYIIGALIKIFQSVYYFIRGVFSLITGDVDGAKEHFGKQFQAIADAFGFAFKAVKEIFLGVINIFRSKLAILMPIFKAVFTVIKVTVVTAFNVIKAVVMTVLKFMGAYFKFVWNNIIKPVIAALKFGFEVAFAGIKIALNVLKEIFKKVWTVIKVAFKVVMIAIAIALAPIIATAMLLFYAFKYAFKAIMAVFNTVWPVITATVGFLWSKVFKPVLTYVAKAFAGVFYAFVSIVKYVWGVISQAISFYWNNVILPIFNLMKTIFEVIWNGIAAVIGFVWNTLILPVFNAMKAVFELVWAGIKLYFETVWSLIQIAIGVGVAVITTAFNVISTVFSAVWDGIKIAFDFVWGLILGAVDLGVGIISGLFNGIKDAFSAVFDALAGIATGAFRVVTSVIESVLNGIIGALEFGINLAIKAINLLIRAYNLVPFVDNVDPLGEVKFGRVDFNKQAATDTLANSYRDANKYRLANGGVVSPSPGGTLAVIGEAGRPERVEPLDPDGLSKRDKAMITLLSGGKGSGITMNVYPSPGMNETELASKISRELAFQLRRGAA